MPGHLVCETGLESAGCAGHDRLIVAASMYLTRTTVWPEAHRKVGHVAESCKERFLVISNTVLVVLVDNW